MYCFGFCFSSLSIKGGEEKLKKLLILSMIFVFFIILAVLWYKENKKMKDLTAARENEKIAIGEKREN